MVEFDYLPTDPVDTAATGNAPYTSHRLEAPMSDPMMRLQKLVKCLNVYLAVTAECGYGLFAAKPFARGYGYRR